MPVSTKRGLFMMLPLTEDYACLSIAKVAYYLAISTFC